MSVTQQQLDQIFEQAKADLSRPRPANEQTLAYIADQFSFTRDQLPQFFATRYAELDMAEQDIVFSPQFTPKFEDTLPYATILQDQALTRDQMNQLVERLEQANIKTPLLLDDQPPVECPPTDIHLERFIGRLSLDAGIDATLYAQLQQQCPADEQPMMLAILRDALYTKAHKRDMLVQVMNQLHADGTLRAATILALSDFLRTYRPNDLAELYQQLESYMKTCIEDQANANDESFHHEQLKAEYAGSDHVVDRAKIAQNHYQDLIDKVQPVLDVVRRLCGEPAPTA